MSFFAQVTNSSAPTTPPSAFRAAACITASFRSSRRTPAAAWDAEFQPTRLRTSERWRLMSWVEPSPTPPPEGGLNRSSQQLKRCMTSERPGGRFRAATGLLLRGPWKTAFIYRQMIWSAGQQGSTRRGLCQASPPKAQPFGPPQQSCLREGEFEPPPTLSVKTGSGRAP